jgi:hypothetical protein
MGLPCAEYHFRTPVPSFDAIGNAIREIEGSEIPMLQEHHPQASLGANHSPDSLSRWFTEDSLRMLDGKRRSITINVLLDGHNIFVSGDSIRLFKSACVALERLGDVNRVNEK